jgi:hypothetical protein
MYWGVGAGDSRIHMNVCLLCIIPAFSILAKICRYSFSVLKYIAVTIFGLEDAHQYTVKFPINRYVWGMGPHT